MQIKQDLSKKLPPTYREFEVIILVAEERAAGFGFGAPAVVAADTGHCAVDAELHEIPYRNVVDMTPDAAAVLVAGIQVLYRGT